jgi:ComF family protein
MLILKDCLHLFFPNCCAACGSPLLGKENVVCLRCRHLLPRTGYHLQRGNPVEQLFWGRIPLIAAGACFEFRKSGSVQNMLHALKYEGARDVGIEIGKIYGRELMQSDLFANNERIVPVPLHPEKQRIRGFNQSEMFARGLTESMPGTHYANAVERAVPTGSQTRKSRFERWKNVETVFQAGPEMSSIQGKKVLLVDDVVTTGATLESCVSVLLRSGAASVCIACIAATG